MTDIRSAVDEGVEQRRMAGRRRSTRKATILMTGLLLVMTGTGALVGALMRSGGNHAVTPRELARLSIAPSGSNPRPIPAADAAVMGLQQLEPTQAANFTLTDQHGTNVSLANADRGHVVVLSFMDDRCTDICPIVAQELVDAYHDLGAQASHVLFLAVNVNAEHSTTRWLQRFIARQGPGLRSMPSFHYLTGSPEALRTVWANYRIHVQVDPVNGNVTHNEAMYFIAPGGTFRYQSTPYANMRPNHTGWLPPATITQWGRGIARYARALIRAPRLGHPAS